MNKTLKRSFICLMLTILCMSAMLIWAKSSDDPDKNIYTSISKNLTILGNIYKEISSNYVEKIDTEKFLKAGINGMLNTLDPYTSYIEEDTKRQLSILTKGKYQGIGLLLNFRNNVVTAAEPPFLGTPAARAGIREGDKIIKVDDTPTRDLGFQESVRHILGPAGTSVKLTIRRQGVEKLLEFTLVREKITVHDVRYAGFIEKGMGYIQLTRFSKNSAPEIAQAIRKFQNENLEGLILDLRSNPGGVLQSAVDVADLFLKKEQPVVSIRGRSKNAKADFHSVHDPVFGNKPLIVLVNRLSASASEIVSGAIQDLDRGIVVGDTTFGKGLVQSVIPLTNQTALKLTTAKYYTPSNRCIQRYNYSIWEDTTSKDTKFYTHNKRMVYGGGGIAPDIYVELPSVNQFVIDLRRKSMFFNFSVYYANTKSFIDSTVQINETILKDFNQYIKEKSYEYEHPFEKTLTAMKNEAKEKKYGEDFIKNIENLNTSITTIKNKMFHSSRDHMKILLRRELASKYFGTKHSVKIGLRDDPVVEKALKILKDKAAYENLLSPPE